LSTCAALVACAHLAVLSASLSWADAAQTNPASVSVRLLRLSATAPGVANEGPAVSGNTTSHAADGSLIAADARRSAPAAPTPLVSPAGPAEAGIVYHSRLELTQPPRPRAPVVVDYPYFDGADDHYVGEFDLFIDDTGRLFTVLLVRLAAHGQETGCRCPSRATKPRRSLMPN